MRIHSQDAQSFIQSLAASITRDPASHEQWRCVYVHHEHPLELASYGPILSSLREYYQQVECDVVLCSDNDLLLVSKYISTEDMVALSNEIICASPADAEHVSITLYDLFNDWRTIRDILLTKVSQQDLGITPLAEHNSALLGDITALTDVFKEACQKRKARQPLHVLLVEDDPLTRRVVANALKDDYALITAQDAREAMAQYMLHAPDIVFLDIGLPDVSGFSVLHAIIDHDPDAYVVMFSGNSYLDNIISALGAGASGFVAKPFRRDKLCHYIQDSALHHHKAFA